MNPPHGTPDSPPANPTILPDAWLVRTTKNLISGPFRAEQIRQMIQSKRLGPNDEICAANHYWISLSETQELAEQLQAREGHHPLPALVQTRAPQAEEAVAVSPEVTQLHPPLRPVPPLPTPPQNPDPERPPVVQDPASTATVPPKRPRWFIILLLALALGLGIAVSLNL